MSLRAIFGWILIVFLVGACGAMMEDEAKSRLRAAVAPFNITASFKSWHLDPMQRAVIVEGLSLGDSFGSFFTSEALHLVFDGLSLEDGLHLKYAVELMQPHMTLSQDSEGIFHVGPWPLVKSPSHHSPHLFPRGIGLVGARISFRSDSYPAPSEEIIKDLAGYARMDVTFGVIKAELSFKDPEQGHYRIRASRSSLAEGMDVHVSLAKAHPSTLSRRLSPLPAHVILDGEISGEIALETDPHSFEPVSLDLENLALDHVILASNVPTLHEYAMEHLEIRRLIGAPLKRTYRIEGLELRNFDSARLKIASVTAPHFEAGEPGTPMPDDMIVFTGILHDTTQAKSLKLAAPVIEEGDRRFHFDHMTVSEIEGPKVTSSEIRLSDIIFDGGQRTLAASKIESTALEGGFGFLRDVNADGLHLSFPDDRLTLKAIRFGENHTQAFQAMGGLAEGLDWSWLSKSLSIERVVLNDTRYQNLVMKRLEGRQSALDLTTHELTIGQLIGTDGKVMAHQNIAEPELSVRGITLSDYHSDPVGEHWDAGGVRISNAHMDWVIYPDNHLEIKGLRSGVGQSGEKSTSSEKKSWTYQIKTLSLDDSDLTLTDLGTKPSTSIGLSHLTLTADDLNNHANDDTDLYAEADIGRKGHIRLSGRLAKQPLSGFIRFDLTHLHLPTFSPYWDALTALKLRRGHLDVVGELCIIPGEPRHYEFAGDAHLEGLEALNEDTGEKIVALESLILDDMDFSSHPKHFSTRVIDFDQAYLHLVLDENHHLNLKKLFRVEDESAVPSEFKDLHMAPSPVTELPYASVRLLKFRDSRLDFTDLGMDPVLATTIRDLEGTLSGLSSRKDATTTVDLKGKINRNSPVLLSGSVKPLDYHDHTDIKLDFTGLNLTGFPQYAGRFSGYRIERGKLNLDLGYQIEKSDMTVDYKAMIDRLTLGEKLDNNTPIFVDLALWLLKDPQGNLDIDLPVYGDLENPSYDRKDLYVQAFFHLFEKVFSTPANLVQNFILPTDQLSSIIPFEPGQRDFDHALAQELSAMVDAYRANEGGIIEITPKSNPTEDRRALATQGLIQKLKESYVRTQRNAGIATLSARLIDLPEEALGEEFEAYCREKYPELIAGFPEASHAALSREHRDQLWHKTIDEWHVEPDRLEDLAEERAYSIRQQLINESHLEGDNIYLKPADLNATETPIIVPIDYSAD